VSSGYRKFSSRFASNTDEPKTFASFATFAGGGQNFEARADTPKIQSAPAKVAQVAEVGTPEFQDAPVKVAQVAKAEATCAACGTADDLWHLDTPAGPVLVHQDCAHFLPKPKAVEPSAAYEAVAAEPDGLGCKVTIVEIPAKGLCYRRTFAHLQLRPPAHVPEDRWRMAVSDGRAFLHRWGEAAQRLGWTSADLFGLHEPPEQPHLSYSRLSRRDCAGFCWLLRGRPVIALTAKTAAIRSAAGNVTVYRRPHQSGGQQAAIERTNNLS
jgi:hypothetical protein